MAEATSIRMAVIGVGGMGQGHCKAMQTIDEMTLTAVCDIEAETAEAVGSEHGVPYYTDYNDLIAANCCDAVLIATPHPVRPSIAIDCMEAGLHLLSEKPLSERASTADQMIAAAQKTGVAFAVDFQRRTEPAFAKAIELVREGRLGKLYRRTMISPEFRTQVYYDSGGWRATWEGEGGGVIMNQSPHILDLFILLGGMPNKVYGRTEKRFHNIEVEDFAEALLNYPDGGSGYFTCSTCEAGPGQMIEIFGELGKLVWRNGELKLYKFSAPVQEFALTADQMWGGPGCEEVPIEVPEKEAGHRCLLQNFARHLLHGEALYAPGAEGLRSLELANAVWLSADQDKAVDLPLDRAAYDTFLARKRQDSTFVKTVRTRKETDPNVG